MQVQSMLLCTYSDSLAKADNEGDKLCFIYFIFSTLVCAVLTTERDRDMGHGAQQLWDGDILGQHRRVLLT